MEREPHILLRKFGLHYCSVMTREQKSHTLTHFVAKIWTLFLTLAVARAEEPHTYTFVAKIWSLFLTLAAARAQEPHIYTFYCENLDFIKSILNNVLYHLR